MSKSHQFAVIAIVFLILSMILSKPWSQLWEKAFCWPDFVSRLCADGTQSTPFCGMDICSPLGTNCQCRKGQRFNFKEGDVIKCRLAYSMFYHVMLGHQNGQVIHLKGGGFFEQKARVRYEPFEQVLNQHELTRVCYIANDEHDRFLGVPFNKDRIVENAFRDLFHLFPYNYIGNNCEHFVNKWRYGKFESLQVPGWLRFFYQQFRN